MTTRTIGFLISHKQGEKRRALLPEDLKRLRNKQAVYVEQGYGEVFYIPDQMYSDQGVQVVPRERVLACDILVDVKLGDADFLDCLERPRILFGWPHAAQSIDFTTQVMAGKHTVIAWEEMYETGRYLFYRNREIAGEAAVMQAFLYLGKMPYESKVALLGRGMTAKGALRILHGYGAEVDVFGRKLENLFKKRMAHYDVIVNCVQWDLDRTDRLIYREDLKKFKPGALIVDVSCNRSLEIETSRPTTIDNPVYEIDRVIHYAVDNTPAMFAHTVSRELSKRLTHAYDLLIEDKPSRVLREACVIRNGELLDPSIARFRERMGV